MSMAVEYHAVNCLQLLVPRHLQRYQYPLLKLLNLYIAMNETDDFFPMSKQNGDRQREHLCETDNWIIITFDCSHISLSVAREVFACVVCQHNLTSTPFGMDTLAVFDRRYHVLAIQQNGNSPGSK